MNEHSEVIKIAQVFNNGRSRAIRIPREFEFDADRVEIRMTEKGDLIVHPLKRKSLLEVLATLEPLGEEDRLPEIEDYPPEPVDLGGIDEK
ncbi:MULTISPECIES: AbrB/MazE/SpoVT family DNA-binding domain-containing protein [Rhizobium/Agrobacterium group]|uniref:antitoxin n=1 Tax=Rhizobium/Agrobacterium group TaxID=227290 RepID=UPI001046B791|nr:MULTISPECIES: AbrB/MazE/SpoVT family DNA-binding domain-containing protein [Rhizobium/Agrobacterium group]TCR91570.1 antitoxin VapB [Rhizobium sp. BK376]